MFGTVLVCLGLDARDQHLVDCCVAFADAFQMRRLLLVHVYPHEPLPSELMGSSRPERDGLGSTVNLWVRDVDRRLSGVEVVGIHAIGRPHEEIRRIEEQEGVDLVILGRAATPLEAHARGFRGRSILRYTSCSVLVLPHGVDPQHQRALVGVDFSHASTEALSAAMHLFPEVHCAYVYSLDKGLSYGGVTSEEFTTRLEENAQRHFLESVSPDLPEGFATPRFQVVKGSPPSTTLIETARALGVDFVVMGSHGQTKLAAMLLGSTAENLAVNSHLPVLVVRHGDRLGVIGSLIHR